EAVGMLGEGSMGVEWLQVGRLSGAGLVVTADVREEARQVSRALGADHTLDPLSCDVVAAVRDLTEGNGADVVFECAGGSPKQGRAGRTALSQSLARVRSGGASA